MIAQIYQNIIDRLKSYDNFLATNGYSKIKHYDLYNNQYQDEYIVQEQPFDFPAIFVEIAIEFNEMGRQTQNGTLMLRLHLVQEKYADSFEGSIDKNDALKLSNYASLIHQCLHMYDQFPFSRLNRKRIVPSVSFSNIYPIILEYQAEVIDNTTDIFKNYVDTDGTQNLKLQGKQLFTKLVETPPPANDITYTVE